MKFGKYRTRVLKNFPEEWGEFSFDYDLLKRKIREVVRPSGISSLALSKSSGDLIPDDLEETIHLGFSEIAKRKLALVKDAVECFFFYMDEEVQKFGNGVSHLLGSLSNDVDVAEKFGKGMKSENDVREFTEKCRSAMDRSILIGHFVFLGYTAMTKILKKLDKNSGFPLHNYYFLVLSQSQFSGIHATKRLDDIRSRVKSILEARNEYLAPLGGPSMEDIYDLIPNSKGVPDIEHYDVDKKFLLSMSGPHGTDIIKLMLKSLSANCCCIHDFAFSRMHHNITFACIIPMPANGTALLQELQKVSHEWNVEFLFEVMRTGADDTDTLSRKLLEEAPYDCRCPYVATAFNQNGICTNFLYEWTDILLSEGISIEKMNRLSTQGTTIKSVDFKISVPPEADSSALRSKIFKMSSTYKVDVAIQASDVFRKSKRLVVFDMDSTLILGEVVNEIAARIGKTDEVERLTSLAMNGNIDFAESLRMRVKLFEGVPLSLIADVANSIVFTDGAQELCRALKTLGYKLAVISGGFMPVALTVKNALGLDYAFANHLEVASDGKTLTGRTLGNIIDAQRKAELMQVIAQSESISLGQVIAVGDGANDLIMLNLAGLGVAFNAKPIVQEGAPARINQPSLINLLYILGYTDDDISKLTCSGQEYGRLTTLPGVQ